MDQIKTCKYVISLVKALLKDEIPPVKPDDISFEDIYKISKKHHIRNMCLYAIEKLEEQPDEELLKVWKNYREISVMQSVVQLSERNTLLRKLNDEGIACLPLKGCLLKEMYPKPEYREMADLDILIHKSDSGRIDQIMAEAGYSKQVRSELSVHTKYEKAPFMDVEMHDRLFNDRFFEEHEVGNDLTEFILNPWRFADHEGSSSIYHLSWEDFYMYLILHLAKHFDVAGVGIRQFVDLWVFLESHEIDHEYVYNKLKGNLSDFCKNAESLVYAWFSDVPVDDELEKMECYIFGSGVYGNLQNKVTNRLSRREKTESKGMAAVSYFLMRAFPPLKTQKKNYPVLNKYPFLLPAVWAHRLMKNISDHNSKGRREVRFFMDYFKKKDKDQ